MNSLLEEYTIEEHRKDITRELDDIRLQEQALNGKAPRPSIFSHTMQRLGQWLIVRGERLVKRYEISANCTTSSKQKYAH